MDLLHRKDPSQIADPAPYADAIRRRHGWARRELRAGSGADRNRALDQVAESRKARECGPQWTDRADAPAVSQETCGQPIENGLPAH